MFSRRLISPLLVILFCVLNAGIGRGEHDGKLQILLLGDSTAEGSIPRLLNKAGPHLETVIASLLAAEGDLPPTHVINLGLSGEYIQRLMKSGRYDREVPKLPGLDYILIRYGINDQARRENFAKNFPQDFHDLLARLRKDHPAAVLIPMTVIPFADEARSAKINDLVRQVATEEKLTLFDIYPRYAAELKKGPNMLNYRRFPLEKIPAKYQAFVKPFVVNETPPKVVVMDNQLDAHFGHLPGWYGDRHPNLAGYNVIGDETAKMLAPVIRAKYGSKPTVMPATAAASAEKSTPAAAPVPTKK